ncbi:MAG TPA: D-alanyl-lipoteichoic acid biosynthesis protein DltD [Verrucomicrobiaceae bacterium]
MNMAARFAFLSRPHLRAAALALGVIALLVLVSIPFSSWLVERHLDELIETPFAIKHQGEWIRRQAFARDNLLSVYGSSEMEVVQPNRPDEFFHPMPTGFRVCPVGAPGNTTVLIAQKIASIGDVIRGKKIAIIVSASWFCRPGVPDDSYAGNFSPLQAGSIVLHDELDPALRRRFIRRMLDFPDSLSAHPLLDSTLRRAEEPGWWPAIVRTVVRPLLWASWAELNWEDHFGTAIAELGFMKTKPPHAGTRNEGTDYDRLIARLEAEEPPKEELDVVPEGGKGDAKFIEDMNASMEWGDFELLLDTVKHFQMQAMVISAPLPASYYERHDVSGAARGHVYRRIKQTCAARGIPAVDFAGHELDDEFTLPRTSHFSDKGWLYVDRVLDDFYHDRLPRPQPAWDAP